ncbi:MAG: hypothetical protein AABZ47_10650 [Planctomycetota bacterium]
MKHSPFKAFVPILAQVVLLGASRELQAGTPLPPIPVNLEWRPDVTTVGVGEAVPLGLYAAAEDDPGQLILDIQVILQWNPQELRLHGPPIDDGDYDWLASFFPVGGLDPDGLNNTFEDGNAFYIAWAQFPPRPFPFVTTSGLHVSTILFEALQETPNTQVTMLDRMLITETFVLDGRIPGNRVTGSLDIANIRIAPEPASLAFFALLAPWICLRARCWNRPR